MPALPADGARHVGVAGIVDNEWLLLVGGAQIDPGQDPSSSQQQRHAVPDYRLPLRPAGDPPVLTKLCQHDQKRHARTVTIGKSTLTRLNC
eukprot:COSAG04_NODE_26490_length_294_cov_0.794872_1_plen_90_part_10